MKHKFLYHMAAAGLTIALLLPLAGCGRTTLDFSDPLNQREIEYQFPTDQTYLNGQDIEGQWGSGLYTGDGAYGIGDPFVLRYNGKYYMYPSSDWGVGEESGIKVFSSDDLVNWTYEGFAVQADEVDSAYAPEVVYYNGWFFMCESQAGRGHYIFRSQSPTGPFERVTDNFGRNIDGAFWIGDDGVLYFLYPTGNTIQIAKIDMETMLPGIETPLTGTLNGWTEGPGLFRRGDYLYLTYAGNSVVSDAYRVGYSYQLGTDPMGQFIMPDDNLLLLSTAANGFRGLGHSSNVIGPDLDSWYTAYHCLVAQSGPQRRYMVDKLLTSGALVTANGPSTTGSAIPDRPDFEARDTDDMTLENGYYFSKQVSEAVYTVECNLTPAAGSVSTMLIGYVDAKHYTQITWDDGSKTLTLTAVSDGKQVQLGSETMDFIAAEVLHTIRVEQGASRLLVYFDGMRKIDVKTAGNVGKLGINAEGNWGYVAFSNDAFGTSDFETVKIAPGTFPATSYLKGENRGFYLKNGQVCEEGIRQGEKENTYLDPSSNSYALVMDTAGDWVKYAISVTQDGFQGLSARISTNSAGAKLQIIVDSKDIYTFTVPSSGLTDEFVNLMLGQFPLTTGEHTLKIRLLDGKLEMTQLKLEATNPTELVYENDMSQLNETGWSYIGNWKIVDGAHSARSGDTAYTYAGDERMTDFTVEVEVAMTEENTIYDAGIMLRAKDHVLGAGVDESFRGYYLSIRNDQITLNRYNYGAETLDLMSVEWKENEFHKIKVIMENNHILVYVDDMETPAIDYYDSNAFLAGQVALCANKAGCAFKNFKIVA